VRIGSLSADNHCLPGSELHFTIPVVVPRSGTQVQISPLSADNHCLPGSELHFTIPVAIQANGHLGADRLVVSRQSPPARGRVPFHDTYNANDCNYQSEDSSVDG
jgi:hypothetical protein